jgi:hypothetical protein
MKQQKRLYKHGVRVTFFLLLWLVFIYSIDFSAIAVPRQNRFYFYRVKIKDRRINKHTRTVKTQPKTGVRHDRANALVENKTALKSTETVGVNKAY